VKRSALQRRTPLKPVSSKRRKHLRLVEDEPGRDAWKKARYGRCEICGAFGRLVLHHVVYEQHVRKHGGDPWDLRNSLKVGAFGVCDCHERQHNAAQRIELRAISDEALDYAIELLGTYVAALYFSSRYDGEFVR
jgi:hypothetical protein